MTRARGAPLVAIFLASPAIAAETIEAGPFSVDVTPQLALRYDGKALIDGDRCVSFRGLKPGEPFLVDQSKGRVEREGSIFTLLVTQGRNTFRREVMVTPEAVHITFEMRIFGPTGGSHLQYDLLTPAEVIDGTEYEVWTGAARGPLKKATGTFDLGESEPLEYLVRSARYFVLKRPGAEVSIDFNPGGAWVGESNYGHNATTSPYHSGERFHWLMLCAGGRHGGIFAGKVIIRPGTQSYESLHSTADVAYTLGFPVALALDFSNADPGGDYESSSAEAPAGKPYRWHEPEQVRIVERQTGGFLYRDFAAPGEGGADGVLELQQRSGHYLVTLNVHDSEESTGPFAIAGPDGPLFENVTVERGKYWFKTAQLRFRDGKADLRFSGDWKVCALTLQTILYETEDFVIDRPFWNTEIGPPDAD